MKLKFTKRDKTILLFMLAHAMATVEILHRRFFSNATIEAVESWLKRMKNQSIVASADLDGQRVYYHLTGHAAKILKQRFQIKVPRASQTPIRPAAKPRRYAALLYCTPTSGPWRELYFPRDHPELFPWVAKQQAEQSQSDPFRARTFYQEGDVLGFLDLDNGRENYLETLKPKLLVLTNSKLDEKQAEFFHSLFERELFRLTIITTNLPRTEFLRSEIRQSTPNFPWEVICLSDVASVLPSPRTPKKELEKREGSNEIT